MTYKAYFITGRGNFRVIDEQANTEDEIINACLAYTNRTGSPSFFARIDRLDGEEILMVKTRFENRNQNGRHQQST